MLDPELFDPFYDDQPKMNPLIANGFATSQVPSAPEYISQFLEQSERDIFPDGVKYIGYQICSPEKTYQVLAAIKVRTKHYYDISHSDVYLVEYRITVHGLPIKRPLYVFMPFCKRGAWLTMKDSHFHIFPVLGDIAISVGDDDLFIRLKMKLKFKRIIHQVYVNDMRESLNVVWSQIHNSKAKKVKSTLMHYLMIKKGLTEAFKSYANADIVIGSMSDVNTASYPTDQWVICKTAKPAFAKSYGKMQVQMRTDVVIAVPLNKWNELTKGMVASFFYLADAYPEQVRLKNELDMPTIWKMLLGHIAFGEGEGLGKIIAAIDTHLDSVDCYLSSNVRRSLEHEDIYVDSIYELFAEIIESYSRRVASSSDRISTMYGKRFYVLRYLLSGIVQSITYFTFALQKHTKAIITETDITKLVHENIKMNTIMYLAGSEHAEIASVSSPTDSLIYKFAMPNILQANTSVTPAGKSVEPSFGEESVLHASLAEICCPNVHPDKDPTSRQRTNFYANIDEQGYIHRHPEYIELIDTIQDKLKR